MVHWSFVRYPMVQCPYIFYRMQCGCRETRKGTTLVMSRGASRLFVSIRPSRLRRSFSTLTIRLKDTKMPVFEIPSGTRVVVGRHLAQYW